MDTSQPYELPNPQSTASFWHKEPSTLLKGHQTTRALPNKADIVIIGSGITGASIAHHIFNQGGGTNNDVWKPEVVMLEAREACWGATGRNGGHCQPLLTRHPHDLSIARFELDNFRTIQALIADRKIDCEFVTQPGARGIFGLATLAKLENILSYLQEAAPDIAKYMRILKTANDITQYRFTGADGVLITDVAARVWPYKFVSRILEDLLNDANLQGRFNLQTLTPATHLRQEKGRWTVVTDRGSIQAEHVVLATNAYTSHLLPEFAHLITPCRGQMSALSPPTWLAGDHRIRTSVGFEGKVMDRYLVQNSVKYGEQLMLGGGRLLRPSLDISDDSVVDEEVAAYLRSTLPQSIDHETGDESELTAQYQWTGIMGWSRDGIPWIGPVPQKPGLYIAAGFTGHGMPNCWLSGRAVATMVTEIACGMDSGRAVAVAKETSGLPQAYLMSPDRAARARYLDLADAETHMMSEEIKLD